MPRHFAALDLVAARSPHTAPLPRFSCTLSHPPLRRTCARPMSAKRVRLSGWVQSPPRPWRAAVSRPARPLRHHPMRGGTRLGRHSRKGPRAVGMGRDHHGAGGRPRGRNGQRGSPDRRNRNPHRDNCHPVGGAGIAVTRVRRHRLSRRDAAQISLRRSEARAAAPQYHAALPCHPVDPQADG